MLGSDGSSWMWQQLLGCCFNSNKVTRYSTGAPQLLPNPLGATSAKQADLSLHGQYAWTNNADRQHQAVEADACTACTVQPIALVAKCCL